MTDTPAPIATPEEITEKIEHAFAGYASEIAAGVNELVAAALASSNAEIERLKRDIPSNLLDGAVRLNELRLENASLTAQVGRMREALAIARPILTSLIAAEHNVETWGLRGRLIKIDAALSPTEPEGKT